MAERKVEIEIKQVANGSGSAAVKRIWKETEANAKQTQKVIEQATKDRAKAELDIEKSLVRSKQNFLKSLEMSSRDTARKMHSIFGEVLAGSFLGTSASNVLSSGLSRAFSGIQTAFQKSLDFSQMKTSLAQFEGSMEGAEQRIQKLFKVAQDTPGLSFLSAIEGQKRLMAVGFAGDQATKILQGLSKVRVLSGSTKEDFDAMIVNLVQIASGGQRVTQEIREMATRMPALVGIIRKEFGGIGKELNEIDPKEFVNRLANAAASSRADFNNMSLAVENLQDAWDRLYIAVGSVIEQNPEVLAAVRVLTKELDTNTNALVTNEGQVRSTFSTWVSWAAKGTISLTNFVDEAQADVSALQNALAAGLNVITGSLMEVIRAVGNYVNLVVIKPINGILTVAQALGPLFGGIASQIGQIPEISLPENIFFRAAQLNWRDVSNSAAKQRSNTRWARYQEELDAIKNTPSPSTPGTFWGQKYSGSGSGPGGSNSGNAGGGSGGGKGGGGRVRASSNADDRDYKALVEFAREMGFEITSTTGGKHKTGSMHYAGKAIDVRTRNRSEEQIGQFVAEAIAKGFRIVDERVKIPGSPAWSGPHLHMEANARRESTLNAGLSYGSIPIGYLRELDNKRFAKKNVTSSEIADYYKRTEIDKPDLEIAREFIGTRDTEIKQNEKLIELYGRLADEIWELEERTHAENAEREISLGLYKEFGPEVENAVRATAKLKDAQEANRKAKEAQKKSDEEALEAMRRYQEEQQRLFDETTNFFEDKINSFIDGGFKGLWRSILDDMRRNFVRQFSTLLAQAFTPNFAGQQQSGGFGGSGGGNVFSNIFGGMFGGAAGGGSMGPGGTPMFNPGNNFVAGGSGQGGFSSFLGSLFGGNSGGQFGNMSGAGTGEPGSGNAVGTGAFGGGGSGGGWLSMLGMGPRKNLLNGKMSGAAGIMGGIGSIAAMAGSMIGGRFGNVLSLAGTGASLGANFGPWGAAIGAGVGALIGIFTGRDNAAQKIKEAALSTYGVTLKDKSVINSIKAIGETYFGKGKVGENASQLMQVDEVKNIIRNYAEATGQNGAKVDMLSHGDVDWSGNRFMGRFGGYRAMGGPVRAGMTYVVGERGRETFTPAVDGNITPAGGGDHEMKVILGALMDAIDTFTQKFGAISKGQMLVEAVEENPEAIQRGVEMSFERDGRATTNFARLTGQYV